MLHQFFAAAVMTAALMAPAPADIETLVAAQADTVQVTNAWARASAGNATTGAAYATVTAMVQPDQLLGAATPVAARAEVHESFSDNGVMKMRPAPALAIMPGKPVVLAPGSYHIMLLDLKQPLKPDQSFPLTLTFAHADPVTVDVHVKPLGQANLARDGMHMR